MEEIQNNPSFTDCSDMSSYVSANPNMDMHKSVY